MQTTISVLMSILTPVSVVVALGAFLKAMLLARDGRRLAMELAEYRADTERQLKSLDYDLQRTTKQLESELAAKTERVRSELRNSELVYSKQFAKEFEAYESIWESVELLSSSAQNIADLHYGPMKEITKAMRDSVASSMAKPWEIFGMTLRASAPFIHETVYDSLKEFQELFGDAWAQNEFGGSSFRAFPTSERIASARMSAMSAIRKRIGLAS